MKNTNRASDIKGSNILKIPSLKDNFGLTKSEFEKYVVRLKDGDESLITTVFKKHFHDSVSYIQKRYNTSYEDSYDACMETMLDFRRKLVQDKITYGNLRFLYTRMASNYFIDGINTKKKVDGAIDVFINSNGYNCVPEEFMEILNKSINKLTENNKELIEACYYSGKKLSVYAEEQNLNYGTLRKKKIRVLSKLKSHFFTLLNHD